MSEVTEVDYAIVGAGAAGAYSAWRILQAAEDAGEPKPTVVIFEQDDRVGGRLLSLEPPGIPDTRVEIGGMRYSDAHRWVCSLTEYLGLQKQPLAAARDENIAYLRSTRMRYQDRTDPDKIPYNLTPEESTPEALSSLIMYSANKAIQEITGDPNAKPTPDTWDEVRYSGTFHGAHLQNLSMRYAILNTMSHEAFQMQQDISGYDSILHTWPIIDGYPWNLGDFGHPVKFHHTIEGYDQVVIQVAERAVDLGAELRLNTRVTSVDDANEADRGFVLETISANDGPSTVLAKRLIMAAPLRSIEILNHDNFFWAPGSDAEALFKTVTPIPLFKLALCYDEPWWQRLDPVHVPGEGDLRITKGKSLTDLPVRQCYYWWTDEDTGRSVILIYDDGVDQKYWAGLRNRAEERYPFDRQAAGGAEETGEWKQHRAPKLMAEEVHRQLLELHGLTGDDTVPRPYASAYMDWGEDPYGGGANFWHVGSDSKKAATAIVRPFDKELYVCGECWSHDQGWVEGALKTAEDMLQNHFGLPAPHWYDPEVPHNG